MKVDFANHYNCSVTLCDENDEEEIDVHQQAISAVIWDTMTGEVYATCGFDEDDIAEEDYFPDDVDESAYDPYMGCDFYETYDIGGDF